MVKTVKFLGHNGGRLDTSISETLNDKQNLSVSIAVKRNTLHELLNLRRDLKHTQAIRLVTLRTQQVEKELHALHLEYRESL